MQNASPQYLRIRDACRTYGVSRATLYRRAAEPGTPIRMVKNGGRTLVEASSLDRWAASLPTVTPRQRHR